MRRLRCGRRCLGCGRGAPFGVRGLSFVVAILAGCDDDTVGLARTSSGIEIPAAAGCTNPSYTGPQPTGGLEPSQIAAAYGIDKLWEAGFHGQGMRVALIEPGERLDLEKFLEFSDCWGPFAVPQEIVVGGGTPKVSAEPNFDAQVLLSIAPGLEGVYMFESVVDSQSQFAPLLAAALDPAHTGGDLVDAISMSFSRCEASWAPDYIEATNAQLRRAAELGVKVFVAGGDAGSAGAFDPEPGEVQCVPHPVPPVPPPGVELGVGFPGSSPWVIDVGGTELAINGRIPEAGSVEGGTLTNEVVWNQELAPGRSAGGGGLSEIFSVVDAAWQQVIGLAGKHHRPDVSALAGSPKYPNGGIGTSGAAPLTTAGMLVVDSYLVSHGVEPTGFLSPVLYALALTDYERVFRDVIDGNNDVYSLGCCYAGPGYDLASGLGSIRFDQLAEALLERAGGPYGSLR
ncbi:MAG: hypothetical protein ACREM1_19985 [Longimicrobiales bacterium]